jgi:cobalamin biosynthesis protein CbiG
MDYPRTLYRISLDSSIYPALLVHNETEHSAARAAGWRDSIPEAIADAESELDTAVEMDDLSPPTREEMESKARELGISFNKRTSDDKLLWRIEQALFGG